MEAKIRWGVLGGGKGSLVGVLHRVASSMHDRYLLVGGCFSSIWEENLAFAREIGIPTHRTYKHINSLIEEELKRPEGQRMQAVSVLTPNYLHYPMVRRLLESGFHVICEKPLTTTYKEAKDLKSVLSNRDQVVAVTYTYTGYPMVRQLRQMIADGAIGELQKVDVQYYQGWINQIMHDKEKRSTTWRLDPEKSGISCCIADIGTHAFNMVEYVTERQVDRILADLNYLYDDNRMDIDGTVLIRMGRKVKGVIRSSQIAAGEDNNLSVAVYGQRGGLKWSQENPNYLIYIRDDKPDKIFKRGHDYNSLLSQISQKVPPGHPEGIFDSMGNIYNGVAKAIRKERYDPAEFPQIADGVRGMDFIEKAVDSNKRGNVWVELDK